MVMYLCTGKRREADTIVAKVERRVYILQERGTEGPGSCNP